MSDEDTTELVALLHQFVDINKDGAVWWNDDSFICNACYEDFVPEYSADHVDIVALRGTHAQDCPVRRAQELLERLDSRA